MTLESFTKLYQKNKQPVSVVVFCEESRVSECSQKLKNLESLEHVKVVVQPCPYEGIEFLFRVNMDIPQAFLGEETDFFWQGLMIKDQNHLNKASEAHYTFLVSILQQDLKQLEQAKKEVLACV